MSFSWENFHNDCRHVSNASIICEDGVIFTHKLVLAAVSKLLQQILSDIPAADEVTFYLKTFEKSKVEEFLNDLFHNKDGHNSELFSIFGVNTSLEPLGLPEHGSQPAEQGCAGPVQSELGAEEPEPEDNIKTDNHINEVEFEVKEEYDTDDIRTLALDSNENQGNRMKINEEIDKVTEEKVKEFEKELIENPKTKKNFIHNRKVNKKIKYEKAIAFFKSGQADSVHHAAVTCGVDSKTLKKLVMKGGSFRGGGTTLRRFSKEEEKVIVQRALELSSSGGNLLTCKLLQKVILEEAEVVKINQPERTEQMTFTNTGLKYFAINLAVRNAIYDHVESTRKDLDKRRIYECEICQKTFTFQNSLVKHRKTCHSFLY